MNKQDQTSFVGNHVVCLLDLLAQEQNLAKWPANPVNGQVTPELITSLKKIVGPVQAFGEGFKDYFDKMGKDPTPALLAALSTEQKKRYYRIKECTIRLERFSDTFLFSSPMSNTQGDIPVTPIYRILRACCIAMMVSLADGKAPLRGAVSVGKGAFLQDGLFYGPALAEAHHLESKVAEHPRVVVSPTVVEFLATGQEYSREPKIALLMGNMAGICRSFICQDTDGQWIVDFLGKGWRDQYPAETPQVNIARMAYDFVRNEADRFRQAGDTKLAPRYESLQKYIESRLPIWGILV